MSSYTESQFVTATPADIKGDVTTQAQIPLPTSNDPTIEVSGTFTGDHDEDWYKITVSKDDVGKKFKIDVASDTPT
jgi:hypothetical protein